MEKGKKYSSAHLQVLVDKDSLSPARSKRRFNYYAEPDRNIHEKLEKMISKSFKQFRADHQKRVSKEDYIKMANVPMLRPVNLPLCENVEENEVLPTENPAFSIIHIKQRPKILGDSSFGDIDYQNYYSTLTDSNYCESLLQATSQLQRQPQKFIDRPIEAAGSTIFSINKSSPVHANREIHGDTPEDKDEVIRSMESQLQSLKMKVLNFKGQNDSGFASKGDLFSQGDLIQEVELSANEGGVLGVIPSSSSHFVNTVFGMTKSRITRPERNKITEERKKKELQKDRLSELLERTKQLSKHTEEIQTLMKLPE